MYELAILHEGEVAHLFSIGSGAVLVGRGGANDIQTSDPSVSWQHAMFFVEAGRVWVRDLGSSNGTFVREERIRGPQMLRDGDRVRLGAGTILRVGYGEGAPDTPVGGIVIQDEESGTGAPVLSDRFTIGSGLGCDLRLEGVPEVAATVMLHAGGELWLGMDDDECAIFPGTTFEVAGRRLVVRTVPGGREATVVPDPDRYPYRVTATLAGVTGPVASVRDLVSRQEYTCEVGNRAILLYLLATKVDEDRRAGCIAQDIGWCSDDDIMSKVWGRHGDANKLHVLLHRLRADVKGAGLDPWFIEKKQRYVRIRVAEVELPATR